MKNDFFDRMCHEAQDEIAHGDKGWKQSDTNTLLLACFGMLNDNITRQVSKPVWALSGSLMAASVALVVTRLI